MLNKHILPSEVALRVASSLLEADVYTQIYTLDNYVIQSSQFGEFTNKHAMVIQSPPKQVESLKAALVDREVTKIMPIATDLIDKIRVDNIIRQFEPNVTVSWGVHPVILPLQFGIVTASGISKSIAASEILKSIGVSPEETLGVGDSTSDWQFIEPCVYGATAGNASEELKQLVLTKGVMYCPIR